MNRQALLQQLQQACRQHNVPALAAGVVDGQNGRLHAVAGVRSVASPEPVTLTDKFHIGSCAKAITATLMLRLACAGCFGLDDTLESCLPPLTKIHPAYYDVTLRQLLNHSAGLPAYKVLHLPQLWRVLRLHGPLPQKRRQFAHGVLANAPAFPPGTAWHYSNAGYVVAAHVAEQIAGSSWETLVQREIFGPLDMTGAGFGLPAAAAAAQPLGHQLRRRWWLWGPQQLRPQPGDSRLALPGFLAPAGDVHATLNDVMTFMQAHLRGLNGQSPLLPAAAFRELHTPFVNETMDYGLGWCIEQRNGRTVSWHNGSAGTFFALMTLIPAANVGVFVGGNAGHAKQACQSVTDQILDAVETAVFLPD